MSEIEFAYAPPRLLAENLWEIKGEWGNKLARRMTVIRLRDGRLFLHSSVRLRREELEWLRSQGKVSWIVAPNTLHDSDAPWMAKQFPEAEVFAPRAKFAQFTKLGIAIKDVNSEFPGSIAGEIECVPMQGTRISEAAFIHKPSHTLVLCDLAFNMGDVFTGLERVLMRWNKVGGRFGPSRLTRLVFTTDSQALKVSYRKLLTYDFDRIIVNHGDVLEAGGRAALRAGVVEVFGE